MVECIECTRLRPFGLCIERINHLQEHIHHCNWYDYINFCPHNLKSTKSETKGL
ncbi:hypothetical protein LCGC14_2562630 [marine sediment metagenome]|uniref:Uncharacterized protein n=1 Tax=marine sediment metagenome TaxID=412755 RepID=A0A0F9B7L0_9ZZZZ